MDPSKQCKKRRFEIKTNLAAILITLLGLLARLWAAHGTFLNPDEALHFRLANHVSLGLAYRDSLTASHPPLLTLVLFFWRLVGTSDLCLRLPPVVAGVAFCWMFYKWLEHAAGSLVGLIGLLFVALLPPVVMLSAEIRQYSLLLAFLASAVYFLQDAFAKQSAGRMAAFSVCLYLAMMSHYSAFLFAAALGVYAVSFLVDHVAAPVVAAWSIGQLGALALAVLLYKTHISKLGAGEATTALQGWMSDSFLRHSYYEPAHGNVLTFLVGHTGGIFQYFFGQRAVGDVVFLFFLFGVAGLLRSRRLAGGRSNGPRLGLFLIAAFAIAACANWARIYPYGGTRHMAFLIIPAAAGVSVAIERIAAGKRGRSLVVTALILVVSIALGKPRKPWMDRADQSDVHMIAAIDFVQNRIVPSDLIYTDYQSDLILGHYLCRQRPVFFEAAPAGFEQFSCSGHRVVSSDFRGWIFGPDNFRQEWQRFVQAYKLQSGDTVWIFQAGWGADLPEELRRLPQFHDLSFESFGRNIKVFKMIVGTGVSIIKLEDGRVVIDSIW